MNELLRKYNIDLSFEEIRNYYFKNSRYYYTLERMCAVDSDIDEIIIASLFSRIAFKEDFAKESIKLFKEVCHHNKEFIDRVSNLIYISEYLKIPETDLEKEFYKVYHKELDKNIIELIDMERDIFRDYQRLSIKEYKIKRIAYLKNAHKVTKNEDFLHLIEYINKKEYTVGFYPGSFNPFHKGHYNILLKAEESFDKVIIGIGLNADKRDIKRYEIPDRIKNREIIKYDGLITTVINEIKKDAKVLVVRGLRNAYDLQYEDTLRHVVEDFLPNQHFIYYFCDKKYEHISSSIIRDLISRSSTDEDIKTNLEKYMM